MNRASRAGLRVSRISSDGPYGATDSVWGDAEVLVKRNVLHQNVVVNEFICNRVAAGLGLSVPAGDLWIDNMAGEPVPQWVIGVVKEQDISIPPATNAYVKKISDLNRALIIMFDELVLNADRSEDNLIVDSRGTYWLIDHDQALFGDISGDDRAVKLLSTVRRRGGDSIGFWTKDLLPSHDSLKAARDRIRFAPKSVFEAGAKELFARGIINKNEKDSIIEFLLKRRENLRLTPVQHTSTEIRGEREELGLFEQSGGFGE